VFEGPSRATWVRSDGGWRFEGVWPTSEQLAALRSRIAAGACLLVVLPLVDSPATALGSEVGLDDDIVEITVSALDWLSARARRRGLAFRRKILDELERTPVLLRPAIMVEQSPGNLRFAVKTSRAPDAADLAFEELADHLFAARRDARSGERRRWLPRRRRLVLS